MKPRVFISFICLFAGCLLSAQNYYMQYTHDTLGNRTNRVRGVLTREMEQEVPSPDTVLHIVVPPSDSVFSIREEEKFDKEDTAKHGALIKTKAEKEAYIKQMMDDVARLEPIKSNHATRDISNYDVGAIPLQYGVSPTGARTYSIPIATAPDIKYAPQLSLVYNSQGGYGYGGYGWDLSGLSSITLASKCLYYDGTITGASVSSRDPVFMLDGIRLVQNEDSLTMNDYPLVTASGHILVAPHIHPATRYISHFSVLFPDGTSSTYGFASQGNMSQLISYPMVESVSIDGDKIQYEYTYNQANDICHLDCIKYGFDSSGNASGVIQWQETCDSVYQYYAGKKIWRKPRIDCLISRLNGETLFYYDLRYSASGGLLEELHLTNSNNREYPPLEFTYGPETPHAGPDSLNVVDSLELDNYWITNLFEKIYKRGKFVSGRYNDGIFSIPDAPTYGYSSSQLYHSPYPSNQHFIFAAVLSGETSVDNSLTAGDGFQTAEVVDVDGDGIDEIVTVNFGQASFVGTYYTIRVFASDSDGVPVQRDSFVVRPSGSVCLGLDYYPSRRSYHWGDFDGDGKCELLMQEFATNGYSENQEKYTTLIDLESHSVLYESNDFIDIDIDDARTLFCMDIDGDGVTEVCRASQIGTIVYRFGSNSSFTPVRNITVLSDSIIESGYTYFTDINADGYIDVLYKVPLSSGEYWQLYKNTGTTFLQETIHIDNRFTDDTFFFIDINRDGYPDAVRILNNYLGYSINNEGVSFGGFVWDLSANVDAKGILPGNVVDYTSMSSFIKVDGQYIKEYSFTTFVPEQRQLVQSTDSFGKIVLSTYRYLPQASLYWTDDPTGISASDGFQLRVLPIYVLIGSKGMMSDAAGAQVFQQDNYLWYDGVVNTRGLGFCGFSKKHTVFYLDTIPVNEVSWYDPQRTGVLTQQIWYFSMQSDNPYRTATYTYDSHSTTYGKLSPRLISSSFNDNTTGVETVSSYSYDSFDFPTGISTLRRIGSTGVPMTDIEQRIYVHSNLPTKYVLGTVSERTVFRNRDGNLTNMLGEKSAFTYDTCFKPLTRTDYKAVAFGNPSSYQYQYYLTGKQRWTYDAHGNILTDESLPYNATEYTGNTYTYDSSGRHLTSSTDALGHTTTYSNFDRYGNPRTVSDHRNRVKTNSFDSWGNQTKTVYADGTVDSTATVWGGQGVYTATRTVSGKPTTIVHYDALSRDIRNGNLRFNGQWQYTDTEYNERSLVKRVSLPFRSSSPSYWNNYTYDSYNRRTKITEASGRITQWSYTGTSVTETKDGVSVTKTSNAAGDVVNVTDAAGAITYILRDDGQPSSVTAPGSVTTMLTYDNYGRRTSIVDPSAGTRSTSYTYNSDGSSVTTETNALGSIVTSVDKYGRVTGVTRTGTGAFDTEYNYDIYGRLTSVVSTNSTSKEYTYDAYDRVSAVKETVPDSKWLQKAYTYGAGSNISSIAYSTQNGAITTESYSYSNGHNTSIAVTGNTNVITVSSENDFGQPTSATSGSVTRTYEYTAYGFPTKRKMSAGMTTIQDLRTFFNPLTGNLTSRFNARYGQPYEEESFSYDALGRLTSAYDGSITYDIKGNTTKITGVGTMTYTDSNHPYRIQRLNAATVNVTRSYNQVVSYAPYDRPASISEIVSGVSYTYNSEYERVKALHTLRGRVSLKKYYIGDCYDLEETSSSTTERLFLGGDAYSSPMVMQRTDNGTWSCYVIGRDYLGSITNITTPFGTSVAEYSYDAWGRMRDPESLTPYALSSQPSLFLGRGYCGHEHLSGYGLINMNARLYDPVLGRFLSPDPYVQAPDFSQNFNRYVYALNNPLKYTDESGEFFMSLLSSVFCPALIPIGIGFDIGCITGGLRGFFTPGMTFWDGAWRGGLTGAVGGALSIIGGGGFVANVLWGAVEGSATGAISALLWGGDVKQGALYGALSGGVLAGVDSGLEAFHNYRSGYGFKTNDGVTYSLIKDQKYQEAIDYICETYGMDSVSMTYNPDLDYYGETSSNGHIDIGPKAFINSSLLKATIVHEYAHSVEDRMVDSFGRFLGWKGNAYSSSFINETLKTDGPIGYANEIYNAGRLHINPYYLQPDYNPLIIEWDNNLIWWYLLPKRFENNVQIFKF